MNKRILLAIYIAFLGCSVYADEVQDMSDPLAVYTQAGVGYTDRGFNLKVGMSYDSGKADTMAMNLIEIQGVFGDAFGYRGDATNKIDSFRFRNFSINTKTGLGAQIDVSYNQNSKTGSASYSLIQALPKMGMFQFYPLGGIGVSVANNVNENDLWADEDSSSGISVPGVFGMIGMYSKVTLTKKIWLNYNPVWMSSIAGSKNYEKNTYGLNHSSIFTHEVSLGYQISPRFNVRYYGNWSNHTDFLDGGQRIEFNYQL